MYSKSNIVLFALFGIISTWNYGVVALSPSALNIIKISDDSMNSPVTLQEQMVQEDALSIKLKNKLIAPKSLKLFLGVVIVISAAYFVLRCLRNLSSKKLNLRQLADKKDGACGDDETRISLQNTRIELATLEDQLSELKLLIEDKQLEQKILSGHEVSVEDKDGLEFRKLTRKHAEEAEARRQRCLGMTQEELAEEQAEHDKMQKAIQKREKEIKKEEKQAQKDKESEAKKEAQRRAKLAKLAAKGDVTARQVLQEIKEQDEAREKAEETRKQQEITKLQDEIKEIMEKIKPLLETRRELVDKKQRIKLTLAHPELSGQQINALALQISEMRISNQQEAAAAPAAAQAAPAEGAAAAPAAPAAPADLIALLAEIDEFGAESDLDE